MSIIPLDLQRRCEQRWTARFARAVPPAAPKQKLEGQDQQLADQVSCSGENPASRE
jgi:hypothetical protein